MSLLALASAIPSTALPIITLYGGTGSRKTQFGIDMPVPFVAKFEDGLGNRKVMSLNMHEVPSESGYKQGFVALLELIKEMGTTEHPYKSLVVDSLDHLSPVVDQFICARDNKPSIESYGYGKGFDAAAEQWLMLMNMFKKLRDRKSMHIVLIAHAAVRTVSDPMQMDGYDRWEPKIPKKACAIVKELSDVIGFSAPKLTITENDKGQSKAVGNGDFTLHLAARPGHESKNRYRLPDSIPMLASAYLAALAAVNPATVDPQGT